MLFQSLDVPRYLAEGIKPNTKGSRLDKFIYGADTETVRGKPLSLQFYSEDCACDEIYFVNAESARANFLEWCASRKKKVQHVVYVHNLSFDLVEFLWGSHDKLAVGEFDFQIGKFRISGVYGTPTFARITTGHGVSIIVVDTFSYFRGSLAKAANLFCPGLPKLKHPAGLGEKVFSRRDSGFVDYAMRDAAVTYHMGKWIEKLHQEFDLTQCVSVADMAARIFKHRFLTYEIPQPDRDIVERSLLSYHGGKNNVVGEPGWYEHTNVIDIRSAYPDAMAKMPAFSKAKLYRTFKLARNVREVPAYGVYCVSGKVAECDWPTLFSHSFKPLSGEIDRVWVQGFELNEALRSGELTQPKVFGHYYDAERDHQAPALRGFVADFYGRKESEPDKVLRYMYKLILNSISGKFIQTRKRGSCAYTDVDANETVTAANLVAGGMFHPFIASAITAEPRARIHRLEHHYQACHTATDSVFFQRRLVRGGNTDIQPGRSKALGTLSVEAEDATLLMLRNKTYVLYLNRAGEKTVPSRVFKGKHILKYALHGFQGNVTQLEELVATGKRTYTVNKANRLKESLKRGLTPNDFVKRQFTLKVGPLAVHAKTSKARRRSQPPKRRQR